MNRASLVIFVSLLVVFSYLTLNSIGDLPETVAIHFDANGVADGWMSRENYRFYVLLSVAGLRCYSFGSWRAFHALGKGAVKFPTANIGLLTIGGDQPRPFCYSTPAG